MRSSNSIYGKERLFDNVIKNGYCIGCGACASVVDSPIRMQLDEYGRFCATFGTTRDNVAMQINLEGVCPFSGQSLDEDQIARELFGNDCEHHDLIGYYLDCYAGFVSENDFRERGSSGGMATWIISELLDLGLIDGAVLVQARQPTHDDRRLFHCKLVTTKEEVRSGAKSRYYPIEMSQAIAQIRTRPGRYAFVGIPCFVKAVRLLMRTDTLLQERIRFCVGLVCGHLKSCAFAEILAWQCDIKPGNLLSIDFRKKLPGKNANEYAVEVIGLQNGRPVTRISPVVDLYGTNWGLGFFKYKACDYCDDVVAETADIVVGDAWLPQYVNDSQGTNVIVVRNPLIHKIIEQAITQGRLHVDRIDANEVARSQDGSFRHRRDGLAYRLYLKDRMKEWYPAKRVQSSGIHSRRLKKIQNMRTMLAEQSHFAFKEAVDALDFSIFQRKMTPLIDRYHKLYQKPLWKRLAGKVKRVILHILKQGVNWSFRKKRLVD